MSLTCANCGSDVEQTRANQHPNGHVTEWACTECDNTGTREVDFDDGETLRGINKA